MRFGVEVKKNEGRNRKKELDRDDVREKEKERQAEKIEGRE